MYKPESCSLSLSSFLTACDEPGEAAAEDCCIVGSLPASDILPPSTALCWPPVAALMTIALVADVVSLSRDAHDGAFVLAVVVHGVTTTPDVVVAGATTTDVVVDGATTTGAVVVAAGCGVLDRPGSVLEL